MVKLIEIEGVGAADAELLEATGWTDVQALAKADPEVLAREISAANAMLKIVERTPDRRAVEQWIAAAARVAGVPESARLRRKPAASPVVPAPVASEVRAEPVSRGEPVLAGSVSRELETALVSRRLSKAPFALPIPARQLAEHGISPSEIAVAELLNPLPGPDAGAAAVVEKPRMQVTEIVPDAPRAPVAPSSPGVPPAPAVQVAEVGSAVTRRGIDQEKVRSVEDAQNDPRPSRSALKTGPQDERLNLLRTTLPETNKGRNPGSRFYIRGVLHDRPLKVWFGGLFALLLQIVVPLAILSAPLLILSAQVPELFSWVPAWIIAFPIAVPVFGILYMMASMGAKCRVCGQRLYVPKRCLKNRKAHHLPYFGHIGALAVHVMMFKWFRCTFCGTSIRIKK